MSVELNWQEGEEHSGVTWDRKAEPLPVATRAPAAVAQGAADARGPSRLRWLLLGAGIGILLGILALGALVLWRANQGGQLARQDVAAAVAQLLEVQAAGDAQRYAGLLDGTDPVWKARLVAGLRNPDLQPIPAFDVEKVRLLGDLAEAEVVLDSSDSALHRLLFFRLVDGQWRLAPPAPAAFGEEMEASTTHFRIHYRQRDERFLPALINLAEGTYVALCGELRCADGGRLLDLRLAYDARADDPASLADAVIVASPSLAGWDANSTPGAQFSRQLAGQIAMQIAAQKAPRASITLIEVIGAWATDEPVNGRIHMDDALGSMAPMQGLISLEQAWTAVVRGNSTDWRARAEIGSVLRFVHDRWGSDAVGRLLEHASGSFDAMTSQAFQVDGRTFQQLWLAWLARQHVPAPEALRG